MIVVHAKVQKPSRYNDILICLLQDHGGETTKIRALLRTTLMVNYVQNIVFIVLTVYIYIYYSHNCIMLFLDSLSHIPH